MPEITPLPPDYAALLTDIRQRVRLVQTRAVMAVNAELIRLYWEIGALIAGRQQQEGWGAGVIPRLARDLHNELPEEKGFSERNIKRMLAFYREYPHVTAGVHEPRNEKGNVFCAEGLARRHALFGNHREFFGRHLKQEGRVARLARLGKTLFIHAHDNVLERHFYGWFFFLF